MGVMLCDRMHSYGPQKHVKITYPNIVETQITPVYLPDAEPATPTWSHTVVAGDLAVVEGVYDYVNSFIGVFSGKNTGAANRVVYATVKLNGSVIVTASSAQIIPNYNWTFNMIDIDLRDIAIGDVVDVYLHASVAGEVYFDYHACYGSPSRFQLVPPTERGVKRRIRDVTFHCEGAQPYPVLTGGDNPSYNLEYGSTLFTVYRVDGYYDMDIKEGVVDTFIPALYESYSFGIFMSGYGDRNYTAAFGIYTWHPFYTRTVNKVTDVYYLLDTDYN